MELKRAEAKLGAVWKICQQCLEVIGIGERKTLESLCNVCNCFVCIENIVEEPAPESAGKQSKSNKSPAKNAVPLIIAAMDEIEKDDEW